MARMNASSQHDRSAYEPILFQDLPSKDLLSPEHFNWADEVEDDLANATLLDTPQSILSQQNFENPYDESAQVPFYPRYKYQPSVPTIFEEAYDDLSGSIFGSSDSESNSYEDLWTDTQESTSELSSFDGSITDGGLSRGDCRLSIDYEARSAAQDAVDNIFADREAWVEADAGIHHFNWMGLRTYTHSATSPSDSLAIILAKSKSLRGSSVRIQSIMNRAVMYIDPVLVLMDDIDENLFELRGSELVRASTGRVFKFYSAHGRWLDDPSDPSEETTTDFGSIQTYEAPTLAIGNGFVESSNICSVVDWSKCRDDVSHASGGLTSLPRKMGWKPKSSSLHQCETICSKTRREKTTKRAQRPRPKITTCVVGAPPEQYYSFPTPVFKRRGVRGLWDQAQRKLASLIPSFKQKQV